MNIVKSFTHPHVVPKLYVCGPQNEFLIIFTALFHKTVNSKKYHTNIPYIYYVLNSFFVYYFIHQGCITLIKSDSKDIYKVTEYLYLKCSFERSDH